LASQYWRRSITGSRRDHGWRILLFSGGNLERIASTFGSATRAAKSHKPVTDWH
jgi:hypothetical protein